MYDLYKPGEEIREDYSKLCKQWEEVLKPINDEKVIVFPDEGKIRPQDHPKWLGVATPGLKIPIGPLESMFAMYHWYSFLGRHLLREEILELTNNIFSGISIKSTTWFDKIKVPKDSLRKVLESLDDGNRHQLKLRCDRWFKDYLSRTPPASKRAGYLVGYRGRLGSLRVKFPMIGGRPVESWKACIHYGVIKSSTDHENRPLEPEKAGLVLLYHYNHGPGGHPNLQKGIDKFSSTLHDKNDKITRELVPLYRKYEHIWKDRAQDMVHEYENEMEGRKPRKIEGRCLEVPSEFRDLLGLKHSHITMDPSYSGWFSELFQTEQSFQQSFVQVASDDPNKLAPMRSENVPANRPGPETALDFAEGSRQASAAGSYQPYDPNDLSQFRRERQQVPADQSLRAAYQQPHHAPPSYDSLSAATTSMGNLSVAALAPAPASGQDQGNVKGKGKRHNRSRSPPQEGRHRKRHNRSRSPPKEGRHRKRQTGDEARANLDQHLAQQRGEKNKRR